MKRDKRAGKVEGRGERRMLKVAFAVGLFAGGCNAQHVLGSVDNGSGGSSGASDAGATLVADASTLTTPTSTGTADAASLGVSQSWSGYFENYQLLTGSDVVKLSFATDPTGVVVGKVTFGVAAPPPPATDPNVDYPPGFDVGLGDYEVAEGFPYSMVNGSLVGGRLRFDAQQDELWTGWCALQTPPGDSFGMCLPNWANGGQTVQDADLGCEITNPETNEDVPVNCDKLILCLHLMVCSCSASDCGPNMNGGALGFDLTFTGNTASGSITGNLGDHNLHLTQDP